MEHIFVYSEGTVFVVWMGQAWPTSCAH